MVTQTAAILMSGGIDSSACAYWLKEQGYTVRGVFINYGQAAAEKELEAVTRVTKQLGIEFDLHTVSSSNTFGVGELVGRNAYLIMSAIFLSRIHTGLLAMGIHAGTPYYDCSPGFFERMRQLVAEHTDGQLGIMAPFLKWHKPAVYEYFKITGLNINTTYSCEAGGAIPCGKCASCGDRKALGC